MAYGLTTDGLIIKTLTVIRDELAQRLRDTFGNSIRLDDRAILGQMVGILSEVTALIWELIEQVNSSQDPDKATGAALDALCTLTGTFRPPASYSVVALTLTGTPTTVVDVDSIAKTSSTDISFQTLEAATITALDAWVTATLYVIGDRVTSGGNAYQATVGGTSATAPTTEDEEITDGSVTWTFLGNGTGAINVSARTTETGGLVASARDIDTIDTATGGWDSVINLLDATVGREVATDEELRLLREAELASPGNTPIDALRGDLLGVPEVLAVTVFANNTDDTNVDGVPPHAVECMIKTVDPVPTGFDQSIWDALLANVAAGIRTHGDVVGTSTDSQGTDHTMKFSRPEELDIYVIVNVTVDEDEYPADGDDLIADAIVAWGDEQLTGKDAVASAITAQAFSVDGVLDVTSVKIGLAPTPTLSVTIPISLRQLAVFDTSRISVVSVMGTP